MGLKARDGDKGERGGPGEGQIWGREKRNSVRNRAETAKVTKQYREKTPNKLLIQ